MTDLDIIKECRQTGRTRTTTKNLLEKAYYEQMTKEIDISKVLIEGDTATIMGVKYKRVEEPKSPAEKAFYAVYGWYPQTTSSVSNYEDNRWSAFQNGYNASKVSETPQEPTTLYDALQCPLYTNKYYLNEDQKDWICRIVEEWLPKEQSAAGSQNVDVEFLVDGFNDCLKEIKGKLR